MVTARNRDLEMLRKGYESGARARTIEIAAFLRRGMEELGSTTTTRALWAAANRIEREYLTEKGGDDE